MGIFIFTIDLNLIEIHAVEVNFDGIWQTICVEYFPYLPLVYKLFFVIIVKRKINSQNTLKFSVNKTLSLSVWNKNLYFFADLGVILSCSEIAIIQDSEIAIIPQKKIAFSKDFQSRIRLYNYKCPSVC